MKRTLIILLLFFGAHLAQANDAAIAPKDFTTLPVQHEGRIKPLDSLARSELRHISGKETLDQQSAIEWLAQLLFAPHQAIQLTLFQIDNLTLRQQLSLPERKGRRYSLAELLPHIERQSDRITELMQKDPKTLTADQQALLRLADQTARYINLLGSANLFQPLAIPDYPTQTYLDALIDHPGLETKLKNLVRKRGKSISTFNASEIQKLELGMRMAQLREGADKSDLLRIIPARISGQKNWLSPWTAVSQDPQLQYHREFLLEWQALATAYRLQDQAGFDSAVIKIKQLDTARASDNFSEWRMNLEIFYHHYQPFQISACIYLIVIILLLLPQRLIPDKFRGGINMLAALGLCIHIIGLIARILILMRAPVGTLYETLLFVTLITAGFSAAQLRNQQQHIFSIIGFVFSAAMLLAAPMISTGDSLDLLVAVLNTNFWLSTHVICITMAYGVCIVASVIANVSLWHEANHKPHKQDSILLLRRTLIAALFLTTFGTVLGGIWADQSWGRFWGWDPKENGALMIVLWLTWILHGRISGKLSPRWFLATSAWLSMIVALSWFGVNLLGAGLHSYGFISGIAAALAGFCILQSGFIAYMLWRCHAKQQLA